jgi:oligo-1,6-glucosidase
LNVPSGTPVFARPAGLPADNPELLIANYPVAAGEPIRRLVLRPYEARVYRLR